MVPMNTILYFLSDYMCILVFSDDPDRFTVTIYHGGRWSDNFYIGGDIAFFDYVVWLK